MYESTNSKVHAERDIRAQRNSVSTFANQIVTLVCGIVIPRMMIGAFGSALYGATTSISQFLSYISLIESGIGRAARSELYRPLAKKDIKPVASVYYAVHNFFRTVAVIFILYTIILAYFYYDIANLESISRTYLFYLVIVISLSTIIDYLCGITNQTLLNADQRKYVTNYTIIITRILNTLLTFLLIHVGGGLILVKLVSSVIIIIRPLFLSWYVRHKYNLQSVSHNKARLPQKWSGMAQHIAYFIHTNTDIVLLTLFSNLKLVAVYAVYSLVVTSVRNLIFSIVGGMEAELGDMFARRESNTLIMRYRKYQFITGTASVFLMGVTGIMIIPFVCLYTQGITDANYIQPVFALIMILAETINCISLPCSTLPVSANHLKKSQWGSFGEAMVNISVSCALIPWDPLIGVAFGTLAAEMFKFTYYSLYASHKILFVAPLESFKNGIILLATVLAFGLIGFAVQKYTIVGNYLVWIIIAAISSLASACVTIAIGFICFRDDTISIIKRILVHLKIMD